MSNVLEFPASRLTVEARAVVFDSQGRILLVHSGSPDLWILPGSEVDAGQGPAEAAVATIKGTPPGDGELVGVFTTRPPDERLIIAYRFESPADAIEEGVFLPMGLTPLNTDPRHQAIAGRTVGGRRRDDRLDVPAPDDHLHDLRRDEGAVTSNPSFVAGMLEAANSGLAMSRGVERGQRMMRMAEVLIGSGEIRQGRQALQEALAMSQIDDITALRCELRLEELDDAHGALIGAWSRLSRATETTEYRHVDLVLAHLGFAAHRRGRRREAEAYLRRAMTLCEDPGRRAALRVSLAFRTSRLITVSA